MSGHGKQPTERSALTSWRWQGGGGGQVRTQKETDRPKRTHILETASGGTCQDTKKTNRVKHTHSLETVERGTCQDMERNQPIEAHSLPENGIGRDLSRHGKKPDRPRHTHKLETASGGTCQDTERNRPTEAHSHSGDGIGRDLSGHGKKPTERSALTNWRWQGEGQVRTRKETDRLRRTHFLETAEGGTCQATERNRPTEVHSLPGDGIGKDLSGHGKKPTERSALTNWRRQEEGLSEHRKKPTDRGAPTS